MRRLPVRIRLALGFAAVMAVLLAATGFYVHQRVESSLDGALNRSLRAHAADVAALAEQSDSGLTEARLTGVVGPPGQVAQIVDARNRVLDATPGLPGRPLVGPSALARARRDSRTLDSSRVVAGQPVRLLATPLRAQGQRLVIVVGQSTEQRDRALSDLTSVLLIGGPMALILASLAGFVLTGAAFRPVEAMRRRAQTISATDLGSRLPSAGGNDELGRLGRTLNEMLARIQTSVLRERTFVSDASHELRTPLAALRTELELMAREQPTGSALELATGSAIEETDRLGRLTDDLLLLARADHNGFALRRTSVKLGELVHPAADRARRHGTQDRPTVEIRAPVDARVLVDRERVGQALDNMLSNAIHFARARVELSADVGEGWVEIHVRDDGPGFAPDFLPQAWERFARADPARTDGGTGLGLPIVRTVAELHDGEANAATRPVGGADVWIRLRWPCDPTVARAVDTAA